MLDTGFLSDYVSLLLSAIRDYFSVSLHLHASVKSRIHCTVGRDRETTGLICRCLRLRRITLNTHGAGSAQRCCS